MARLATPGVYVRENNAFSSSVVAAPTAIPAFIGYTAKAERGHESLTNTPHRVDSFKEFLNYFGRGPKISFSIKAKDNADYSLKLDPESQFHLYNSLRLFYSNGGGACYIISVGNYSSGVKLKELSAGLEMLVTEQEPSIVACPDSVSLDSKECMELYREVLNHCGRETRDRFAIFDVPGGFESRSYDSKDVINQFRDGVGHNNLAFGAAYYPFLNTTVVSGSEISYRNISNRKELVKVLTQEAEIRYLGGVQQSAAPAKPAAGAAKGAKAPAAAKPVKVADARAQQKFNEVKKEIDKLISNDGSPSVLDQNLKAISGTYNQVLREIKEKVNLMPTVGAIAGIYASVDNNIGVHKAPANIGLNSVLSPSVNVTGPVQEDLNLPVNGKAVNAIRSFIGKRCISLGCENSRW